LNLDTPQIRMLLNLFINQNEPILLANFDEKYYGVFLIGYHASHEQFSPNELLKLVQLAESAGFEGVLSSDHFYH
jgi:hypothetical protein